MGSQAPRRRSVAFFLGAALTLCGCSDPTTPGPGPLDGGGCNSGNCTGCCQGETCITATSTSACGAAGFACVVCSALESCSHGQCVSSTSCGASVCPGGCCKNDKCLSGDDGNSCGKGGALCMDCSKGGGTCKDHVCQGGAGCGAATCNGCCQGGQCFGGAADKTCGSGGLSCVDCTQSGDTCDPTSLTCRKTPACGKGSCAGCCKGGQCLPGSATGACGMGGVGCVDCAQYSSTCDAKTGQCQGLPPACDAASCPGCCKSGQCLPGSTTADCGKGGVGCVDCAKYASTCNAGSGQCQGAPSCGPSTCAGCCSGSACLGGASDSACGAGGQPCQNCSQLSQTCDGALGSCKAAPSCGPSTCSGCCAGTTCLSGTSASACGAGGAGCVTCGKSYHLCSAGACVINPTSKWSISVSYANIKDLPGKTWDSMAIGSARDPDPYVGIDWDTCSKWSVDSPCSGYQSNTFNPSWFFNLGTFTASKMKTSWCAFVGDADGVAACSPPFNTIALCPVKITDNDLESGSRNLSSCPNPDDSINYISTLRFTFQYKP